jgi:hypothetical protein
MEIGDGRRNMVRAIAERCNGNGGLTRGSAHGLMKDDEGESCYLLCVDSLYWESEYLPETLRQMIFLL